MAQDEKCGTQNEAKVRDAGSVRDSAKKYYDCYMWLLWWHEHKNASRAGTGNG